MTREYLLKVIEKHFWVLSKDEIAKQIANANVELPDFIRDMLMIQDVELNNEEKRKIFHPYFCDAIGNVRGEISLWEQEKLTIWGCEKLFDSCLLLISIFYHYSAVLVPNVMADFLRVVLLKKILLT